MTRALGFFASALTLTALLHAAAARAQTPPAPKPTLKDVAYGQHPRQRLDVYRARSDRPAPVLFYVHGGGWMQGDKNTPDFLVPCLKSGVSVVSIDYRLIPDAIAQGVTPPVKACLDDTARALQFVRSHAADWNIDKERITGCGGSAGGFNTLWLAFHPDLADPGSDDPVARESTRLRCAVAFVPQTSLDPVQMRSWIPNVNYGHHAFALSNFQQFVDRRAELLKWIEDYSPYALATSDDPPVYLYYDSAPGLGQPCKDPPHSANFGAGLVERLKAVGIEHEFNYPGAPDVKHPDIFSFLTEKLQASGAGK